MTAVEKAGFCTLCRSRCGTINVVENDRLIAVRANPAHPTGKAICPKGRAAPEIAHAARRLRTPLRRTAPKGAADPGFVPIPWDAALAEIAGKLARFAAESGPESVAFGVTSGSSSSTSDGLDWIQRLIRGFGSPNTLFSTEICNWHKDHAHAFTFGCGLPTADYRNSDLILLWGHNPANVWLAQAESIAAARARGARVVVVDPRKSGSANDADLWLRVRPGADTVLALGVAHLLIENGTFDEGFARDWTNGPLLVREDDGRFLRARDAGGADDGYLVWDEGADAPASAESRPARAALRGEFVVAGIACRTAFSHYARAAAAYPPGEVERIAGVPAAQTVELARLLGQAKSVCYHGWTGIGQHTNATQTERAIATLYALTGSFDAPGGNVRMPALPSPALHSMALMPAGQRAKALGLAERPLGPPLDGWITSTDFYDAVLDRRPYAVRALFAFGSNLLVSHPAPERGRRALAALEFQVHCDLFANPTSAYADIVLPVSSPWENEALRLGFEISPAAQELVQLRQRIVPRQGEARSDTEIVFALAKRLGMGALFFDGDVEAGWNHQLAPLGLDVDTLRRNPQGVRVALAHRHRKYREDGFATETRRVELYSEKLLRHGQPPVPRYFAPAEPQAAAFPLRLVSVNNGYFCHSQHRGIAALRRKRPEPVAELHPALAAARRIGDGDRIEIRTRLGAIRVKAAYNDALETDIVVSDYGWWQGQDDLGLANHPIDKGEAAGANFNGLIDERQRDPVSGALGLRSFACDVAPAEARPWRGFRPFRVAARGRETADVVSLSLEPVDAAPLAAFRPGQFIGLRVDGRTRSYSLTGRAERQSEAYTIGVKHVPGGAVSGHIAQALKPGGIVEVQAPSGGFLLPLRNEFPVVLIAGGIGITPFLSYLESLDGASGEPEIVLHYGSRNARDCAFADRLDALAARLPKLSIRHHFSRPDPNDRAHEAGRMTPADIGADLIARRARFYICASEAMTDGLVAGLTARGVPAFEIFREIFRSPPPPVVEAASAREVVFKRAGRRLRWTPESGTLLDFAEENGVAMPSGCRVGQCESCAVKVIAGTVRHLCATDIGADGCLACQALPLSDLVLDI